MIPARGRNRQRQMREICAVLTPKPAALHWFTPGESLTWAFTGTLPCRAPGGLGSPRSPRSPGRAGPDVILKTDRGTHNTGLS